MSDSVNSKRTFTSLLPEKWVEDDGKLTSYAGQFLTRLAQYIGNPASGTTVSGGSSGSSIGTPSLVEQISNVNTVLQTLLSTGVDPVALGQLQTLLQSSSLAPVPYPSVSDETTINIYDQHQSSGISAITPIAPSGNNDIITLHNGAVILDGFGSPYGVIPGNIGDFYLQRDGSISGASWSNTTGGVNGWVIDSPRTVFDKASIYLNTATSTTSAGWQKIPLDTVSYDTNSIYVSAGKYLQPKKAGYYQINGRARINAAAILGALAVGVNGVQAYGMGPDPAALSVLAVGGSSLGYFNGTTDYLELWIYCTTAGNAFTLGGFDTYMDVCGPF